MLNEYVYRIVLLCAFEFSHFLFHNFNCVLTLFVGLSELLTAVMCDPHSLIFRSTVHFILVYKNVHVLFTVVIYPCCVF
jgi:hypothetical protein